MLAPDMVREITEDEVRSYVRDGWAFLPGLVKLDCVDALLTAAKEVMGEAGNDWVARHGKDAQLGHWQDRHFLARDGIEPFRSFAMSQLMGRAAKRLMEREVTIRYWADMIAVKQPVGSSVPSTATPLHQDYSNKHFDRTGNVTFWIALEDTPAAKGTCRYRSGSHKLGPLGHEFGRKHSGGTGLDIHDVYPWLAERYPLSEQRDMKAGDATVHGGLTLHCASENRGDSPRWAYITLYIPGDALWTGSQFLGMDNAELQIGQQFNHPFFPIICE